MIVHVLCVGLLELNNEDINAVPDSRRYRYLRRMQFSHAAASIPRFSWSPRFHNCIYTPRPGTDQRQQLRQEPKNCCSSPCRSSLEQRHRGAVGVNSRKRLVPTPKALFLMKPHLENFFSGMGSVNFPPQSAKKLSQPSVGYTCVRIG